MPGLGGAPHRFAPALPVDKYVTYQVSTSIGPGGMFWRPATCEEFECPAWANGWVSKIDEATELGQAQAHYIRHDRSRRHTETKAPDGLTWFAFEPGQDCYQTDQHQVRNTRPPVYLVRGGDWRGNTGDGRIFDRDDQWVDDFATHQQRLYDAQQ